MNNRIKRILSKLVAKLDGSTEKADVVLSQGDFLTFKSHIHGSVGLWYELDYDKVAFSESRSYKYVSPSFEAHPCPGGDEKIVEVRLTALKKGRFLITEIENFRGEQIVKKIHKIRVK